ncbi:MAG: hypothetical protein JWM10_363 [Myxococcaceae bacterium]|nr:hypothetical protein [Myxococcaceae bacterium]
MPEINYLRGAFIAYQPDAQPNAEQRVIPFRFNPESLSRQFSIEQGYSPMSTEGAGSKTSGSAKGVAADATSGVARQTFSVQVRFDFADRHELTIALDPTLGILPELSALEGLMLPWESPADARGDAREPVRPRQQRPEVLFVWGFKRVLPVRITGMTINETFFNASLNATRAEVEVQLAVLGDADAENNRRVKGALAFTESKRQDMARLYLATSALQGTRIPQLPR